MRCDGRLTYAFHPPAARYRARDRSPISGVLIESVDGRAHRSALSRPLKRAAAAPAIITMTLVGRIGPLPWGARPERKRFRGYPRSQRSVLGQSRRSDRGPTTSGLPLKADVLSVRRHVSKVPTPQLAGKLLKGNCGRSTAADEVISEKGPEAMADGPSRARQVSNLAISNSIIERPINGRPCFGSALHR